MAKLKEKIGIGSDHAGYKLKELIKDRLVKDELYDIIDFGTYSEDSVDYPDYAHPVGRGIEDGVFRRAIVICGSGNGVNMTVNKYSSVRSAVCWRAKIAELARLHNDANVLALPARFVSDEEALEMTEIFLNTAFEGGRHKNRVDKICL